MKETDILTKNILHTKWLEHKNDGVRADFGGMYLKGEKFNIWANTNFKKAFFVQSNLESADFRGVNLKGAYFTRSNLSGAEFRGANLQDADFEGASLFGANLSDANLKDIKVNLCTIGYFLACPSEGAFTAFKKAGGYIVVLEVPADARRSSATTYKCRCDKAKVLRIENLDGTPTDVTSVASRYDCDFVYTVGETVSVENFDENRWNECSTGIHFFIDRELAVLY